MQIGTARCCTQAKPEAIHARLPEGPTEYSRHRVWALPAKVPVQGAHQRTYAVNIDRIKSEDWTRRVMGA